MAVRYKFRSAVNFDSVDIDGRPSISIRDLKSKIVHHKKLNICQDFDLVFCDALTGQEYTDENVHILSNACVIIKRVPAGSEPSDMARNRTSANLSTKKTEEVRTSYAPNAEINFDDFGVDLCPISEATLSFSDVDNEKNFFNKSERTSIDVTRCLGQPTAGSQKLDIRLIASFPTGPARHGAEENMIKLDGKKCMGLEKTNNCNPPAMPDAYFPSELNCSLCKTFFKDAVMIPCCQHSFCKKCICLVLAEKGCCPMCFSSKCSVEDLLPNISLQQAIEHYLESQNISCDSENALDRYAPDEESGIQAGDVPCAATVCKRDVHEMPDSPCSTVRGSDQIVDVPTHESHIRKKTSIGVTCVKQLGGVKSLNPCPLPLKMTQIEGERHGSVHVVRSKHRDLADISGFQGAEKTCVENGRFKKGAKTCYICGSPDHFKRNCPVALSPHPMNQIGNMFPGAMGDYVSPYWNGSSLPHVRHFSNCYGNPGIMHLNTVPATPFPVPPYMSSTISSLPCYGGMMQMEGLRVPVDNGLERSLCSSGLLSLEDCEQRQKFLYHDMSGWSFDDEGGRKNNRHRDETEILHHLKSRKSMERHKSDSGYGFAHRKQQREINLDDNNNSNDMKHEKCPQTSVAGRGHRRVHCDGHLDNDKYSVDMVHEKSSHSPIAARGRKRHQHDISLHKKNYSAVKNIEKCSHSSIKGRERRPYHQSERLGSDLENMPCSPSSYGDDRYRNHHSSSKRQNERTNKRCCDSSSGNHLTDIERDARIKSEKFDVKRHGQKHNRRAESDLESGYSSDQDKQQKENDFEHGRIHSGFNSRYMGAPQHDRRLMVSGFDKNVEDHHYFKRKRVY